MSIIKVSNLFSDTELLQLNNSINDLSLLDDSHLGRVHNVFQVHERDINMKIYDLANSLSDKKVHLASAAYAYYSNIHGEPNLPPHFDSDTTDLIIDYQLESNISWDLGINTELYPLEDNSAIVFNPNTNIHWRPHRRFEDGEYVKMLFFRFIGVDSVSDYSHTDYSLDSDIFKSVRDLRDSLK
jgi:uncharacterized protein (DUF488 family)